MAHSLKGKSVAFFPSTVDVFYAGILDFMENVIGFPWVIEEVSDTEKRYYLDDSRKIGFTAIKGTAVSNSGLYVFSNGNKATNPTIYANSATIKLYIYGQVSSGENTVYICGFNTANYINGAVAAKDESEKWSVLYSNNNVGYIANENYINLNCKLADTKNYDFNGSSYSLVKAPNGISGVEFKELYWVPFCPAKPSIDINTGLQEIYVTAEGKTYRLVPLYKDYIVLGLPVSD
ncbi:MAG: hypothetical protein ACI4J7_06055 [Ruminiclostridium sp.]